MSIYCYMEQNTIHQCCQDNERTLVNLVSTYLTPRKFAQVASLVTIFSFLRRDLITVQVLQYMPSMSWLAVLLDCSILESWIPMNKQYI